MTCRMFLKRQGFGEFDHLSGSEIEIVGPHAGIDVDPDLHELAAGGSVKPVPVDDAEAGELRLVAEIDVLTDRQVGQ